MITARGPRRSLAFVIPPLDGSVSGGTLYNRELIAALAAHADVRVLDLDCEARLVEDSSCVWIDSLFLARVPELKRRFARPIAIFLHYLPSFVALARPARAAELSAEERAALASAAALWVPSAFMRDALEPIVAPPQNINVLEPGTHARLLAPRESLRESLRVLCVGNVIPGKGYSELLTELGKSLEPSDRCELTIVGSLTADRAYAERCMALVRARPTLAERVRFVGELSSQTALAEFTRADLFVSASRMESYGMALAEARVSGVPIAALDRGNARAHVHPESGGKLAENFEELAVHVVTLARAPQRLLECTRRARANAPSPRRWPDVALEFLAQVAKYEK